MPKYGRGLAIEFADAVRKGEVKEPFNTEDLRKFAAEKGWFPRDNYTSVLLPNSSSKTHSHTYRKLFEPVGNGYYILSKKEIGY